MNVTLFNLIHPELLLFLLCRMQTSLPGPFILSLFRWLIIYSKFIGKKRKARKLIPGAIPNIIPHHTPATATTKTRPNVMEKIQQREVRLFVCGRILWSLFKATYAEVRYCLPVSYSSNNIRDIPGGKMFAFASFILELSVYEHSLFSLFRRCFTP